MDNLFLALFLFSILGLFIGLIKPSLLKLKSRKQSSKIFVSGIILFFILFTITLDSPIKETTPIVSDIPPAVVRVSPAKVEAIPEKPLTDQQKIEKIVRSALTTSSNLTYATTDITNDQSPAPEGSKYLVIKINSGTLTSENSFITNTGKLSSQIFKEVFSALSNAYDISVLYYGKTTDQYGNKKDNLLMSYTMDRPLFNKINWSGFSGVQNDIHLCAFLRQEFNTMTRSEKDQSVIGCAVGPSNL
jgi:hypothetical protein